MKVFALMLLFCTVPSEGTVQNDIAIPDDGSKVIEVLGRHAQSLLVGGENGYSRRRISFAAPDSEADFAYWLENSKDHSLAGAQRSKRMRECSRLVVVSVGDSSAWSLFDDGQPISAASSSVLFVPNTSWQIELMFLANGDKEMAAASRGNSNPLAMRSDVNILQAFRSFIAWFDAQGGVPNLKKDGEWSGSWNIANGLPPIPGLPLHSAVLSYVTTIEVRVQWDEEAGGTLSCLMEEFDKNGNCIRATSICSQMDSATSTFITRTMSPITALSTLETTELTFPIDRATAQDELERVENMTTTGKIKDRRFPGFTVEYELSESGLWQLDNLREFLLQEG